MPIVAVNRPSLPGAVAPGIRQRSRRLVDPPEGDDESLLALAGEPVAIDTYHVGFGKPPRHRQFKPGRSGNPKGRPKKAKSLDTVIREALLELTTVRTAHGDKRISRIEALVMKTIEKASKGDMRALDSLLKYYRQAVPSEPVSTSDAVQATADLTAGDIAGLELLRQMFAEDALAHSAASSASLVR